ncbi:SgcJ/EcaC family oxidoreductase [Nocardioides panacisoli]|uniref:SgcJ/EcaC family oxidoreductase n=1 Tax=Nocardioides panacisoli TaxID=627624 RepID=UPI001C63AF65|nr:SgcJ/EcaC family oxidoreductase [Nocardioides panacisoli]QYJ03546.1 SgcJ/EcaC family oxidoreductase [Nocardioides panacisoli]
MKVLIIGGTGYLGSAIVHKLRAAGHVPVVFARSASGPPGAPFEHRMGDLAEPSSIRAAVTDDIDAVVHAGAPTGDWNVDLDAIDALCTALEGRAGALVYLSGIWVLGQSDEALDENAAPSPIEIVCRRPEVEDRVLHTSAVRGLVVRPGIVHGAGGGIPAMMVGWARARGHGVFVGETDVRWPMVHLDDLADLVVLAVEKGEHGSVLHGVAEPAVAVVDIAAAADVAAGGSGTAEPWAEQEAAASIGEQLAEAMALTQVITADAAHNMGWTPAGPGAVADLREGSYAHQVPAVQVQPAAAAARREDLTQIVALVRALQSAQQSEDASAFTALFQQDAVWTTAHGHRMIGWDEIDAFTRRVLPGAMRESTATYRVEHVLFLGADVVVVNVRQQPVTLTGTPVDGVPEGRPVYVLAKSDGTWRIAAGQNTQVHTS